MAATFDPDEAGKMADEIIESAKKALEEDAGLQDSDKEDLLKDDDSSDDADANADANADKNADADADDKEDWKHKYDVMQGKYNTETARLRDELNAALLEKQRLSSRSEDDPIKKAVDEKVSALEGEVQAFSDAYPNLFEGLNALITKRLGDIVPELDKVKARTEEVAARTEREKYLSVLDKDIPKWRDVNKSTKFHEWLKVKDRYTGADKHNLLMSAYNSFNLDTTKAFFEDFAKEEGIDLGVGKVNEPDTSSSKRSNATNVSPNNVDSPRTFSIKEGQGKFIARSEIEAFYKDRAMGRFTGTEEDAIKVEAKILKAVQEGRVR